MKRNSVIVLAATLVLAIAFTSWLRSRKRSFPPQMGSVSSSQTIPLDPGPHGVSTLPDEKIASLSSTQRGRELLCSLVGSEGSGLDEKSYVTAEAALLRQQTVERDCLEEITSRLEDELLDEKLNGPVASHDDEVSLGIKILKKYPVIVRAIVRDKYFIGSDKADVVAEPLMLKLGNKNLCPDIESSLSALKRNNNLNAISFAETYSRLCK